MAVSLRASDLIDDLPDQGRFARSGVTGDLDMVRFAIAFDHEIFRRSAGSQPLKNVAPVVDSEAQAIASGLPIEAPTAGQSRTAQTPSIPRFRSCCRVRDELPPG